MPGLLLNAPTRCRRLHRCPPLTNLTVLLKAIRSGLSAVGRSINLPFNRIQGLKWFMPVTKVVFLYLLRAWGRPKRSSVLLNATELTARFPRSRVK